MGTPDKILCFATYQLVKDLRNKVENTNPSSVLDGNIDQFIEEGIKNCNEKDFFFNFYGLLFVFLITFLIILSTIGLETKDSTILFQIKSTKLIIILY